jgi:hypothetical protein
MIESMAGMALTGGASAALGAGLSLIGKVVNLSNENKRLASARGAEEMRVISEMADAAGKRGGGSGAWIRRFIVISLFGFLFGVLSINGIMQSFMENGIPATYAYMEEIPSRWFGLLRAKSVLKTVPLAGIPVFSQAVNMVWLVGTFYFGSSRIK